MSTIYYALLKKIFSAIGAHTPLVGALQRLAKMLLDHIDHVERTRNKNFARTCSELKILVCDDDLN